MNNQSPAANSALTSRTSNKLQIGSTLLGIIIGLIVGLAIAVVVALVITKGSSPFTNKLGKPASESATTPIADPNKPLYGNTAPAKEAAKEFAKEAEAAKNAEAALANPSPTPVAPPVVNTTPVGLDPNKVKPTATPTAPATPTASPTPTAVAKQDSKDGSKTEGADEKWIYYLQAGAFREQTDAENTRAKLALLGFEANISERNSDNGVLFRVRLGPYNQVEAMNRVRGKLSENGVDVAVIRNQK
ncbi:MAG: SPOR domain-containing protein [Burkholderiales bacterium]|nr:SPOR domain-containing protein [Burkholderiales bacterium]